MVPSLEIEAMISDTRKTLNGLSCKLQRLTTQLEAAKDYDLATATAPSSKHSNIIAFPIKTADEVLPGTEFLEESITVAKRIWEKIYTFFKELIKAIGKAFGLGKKKSDSEADAAFETMKEEADIETTDEMSEEDIEELKEIQKNIDKLHSTAFKGVTDEDLVYDPKNITEPVFALQESRREVSRIKVITKKRKEQSAANAAILRDIFPDLGTPAEIISYIDAVNESISFVTNVNIGLMKLYLKIMDNYESPSMLETAMVSFYAKHEFANATMESMESKPKTSFRKMLLAPEALIQKPSDDVIKLPQLVTTFKNKNKTLSEFSAATYAEMVGFLNGHYNELANNLKAYNTTANDLVSKVKDFENSKRINFIELEVHWNNALPTLLEAARRDSEKAVLKSISDSIRSIPVIAAKNIKRVNDISTFVRRLQVAVSSLAPEKSL